MSDFFSFLDFAIDIVCMMPPIHAVEDIILTRDQSILIAFCAMGFLVVTVTAVAMKDIFTDSPLIPVVIVVCVAGIGFIGLKQQMIREIFMTAYPPMVIALRVGEGAIVGDRTSPYLRWWHSILFLTVIIGLYCLLRSLPSNSLAAIKGCWALFGVIAASIVWTRMMADAPFFRSHLCLIAVFAVFASTLAYVSASPLERAVYQWALPGGMVIGIIARRHSPRRPNGTKAKRPNR